MREKTVLSYSALYEVNVPFLRESLIKGGECLGRFEGVRSLVANVLPLTLWLSSTL